MPAIEDDVVIMHNGKAGPGRFGRQASVTDIYHTIPYLTFHTTRNESTQCLVHAANAHSYVRIPHLHMHI